MKKAWNDNKSFITVSVMILFGYCIIRQIQVPEELKNITLMVVSFFLGTKVQKESDNNGNDNNK